MKATFYGVSDSVIWSKIKCDVSNLFRSIKTKYTSNTHASGRVGARLPDITYTILITVMSERYVNI